MENEYDSELSIVICVANLWEVLEHNSMNPLLVEILEKHSSLRVDLQEYLESKMPE